MWLNNDTQQLEMLVIFSNDTQLIGLCLVIDLFLLFKILFID